MKVRLMDIPNGMVFKRFRLSETEFIKGPFIQDCNINKYMCAYYDANRRASGIFLGGNTIVYIGTDEQE